MSISLEHRLDSSCYGPLAKETSRKRKAEAKVDEFARANIQETEASSGASSTLPSKKRKITEHPNPLVELSREDTFIIGIHAANKHQMELLEELGEEAIEQFKCALKNENEDLCNVPLKRFQEKEIKEISENISEMIGAQFFELFQILESARKTKTTQGEAILSFARELISSLPRSEASNIVEAEVDPKYLELAKSYLEKLPFHQSEEDIAKFALSLQKKAEKDEEQEEEAVDDREDLIDFATQTLGSLLLSLQHNIAETADCLSGKSVDEAVNALSTRTNDILMAGKERIEAHAEEHQRAAIQGSDEAAFVKFSEELAQVLVLDSGSINFGIIERAADFYIPEKFKKTVAIDNLYLVLKELATNSTLWEIIANSKPPQSKEIPTDAAMRAFFGLDADQQISRRHAQVFVLSGLLGHVRQGNVGTCFATACLIKCLYAYPQFFAKDLSELTEKGSISRVLFSENRVFPMIERVSNEYLDTLIRADSHGKIRAVNFYSKKRDSTEKSPHPSKNAFLYEAPGIIAVCQAMRLRDAKEAVMAVIPKLKESFSVNELIQQLAQYAYNQQESNPYWLRSQTKLSMEQLVSKGQFAFGIQTNHPLHRGYDQVASSLVDIFGAQYYMPSWVYLTLENVLEKNAQHFPRSFQKKYKLLIKEMFLPMISRMRYRYNPNFDTHKVLFDDGNHGVHDSNWYGYQLCDTGLPNDFAYSQNLYKDYHSARSFHTLERFDGYAPPQEWRSIETAEKFRDFLKEVAEATFSHLIQDIPSKVEREEWENVLEKMLQELAAPALIKKMICKILGPESDQKKKFEKNEFGLDTTPWQFSWGGDFNEVLKTFFGFDDSPSKLKPYNGTPKEVLAKCINYIKGKPESFKEEYVDAASQIIVTSPVHAFLLRPFEPTFKDAWTSSLNTNEYISQNVEGPGLEVAHSRISHRQRLELIAFVAENKWTSRYLEKEDWVRQQITEESKRIFDEKIATSPGIFEMTVDEFEEKIAEIVVESRAADPNIGKRNLPWEKSFKLFFHKLVKKLVPSEEERKKQISVEAAAKMLDYARNRKDIIALSEGASKHFERLMEKVPHGLTVKEFRSAAVNAAYDARCNDLHGSDPAWKEKFSSFFDDKLFSVLPTKDKQKLIASGIVTHDTNWHSGVHDLLFIFLVNPGTGKIEMATFNQDEQKVNFMAQSHWFPRKEKRHGYWEFPDNYRVWKGAPLISVKRLMGI